MTTTMGNTIANPNAVLGKNAFLQLMVSQLQNQNPLDSTNSSQFLDQLAQFSSLEQLTNLATSTQTLSTETGIEAGTNLLGRTVTVLDSTGAQTSGVVSAVDLSNGSPQIVVNGQPYAMTSISKIS